MIAAIILIIIGISVIIEGATVDPHSLISDDFSLKIFLYTIGSWLIFLSLVLAGLSILKIRRNRNLIQHGIKGTALILSSIATGVTQFNNMPVFNFELEIQVPGKTPYRIVKSSVVNLAHIGRAAKGEKLPIVVDPTKRDKILILWNE